MQNKNVRKLKKTDYLSNFEVERDSLRRKSKRKTTT